VPRELVGWFGKYIKRQPDITLFLEASLDVVRHRKEATTMSDLDFARRVERGYQQLVGSLSWVRVNATQRPEQVKKCCLEIILPRLQEAER